MKLWLEITNIYEDGDTIVNRTTTDVPAPESFDDDELDDWAFDHLYPLTGTGRTEGDAAYFVKVLGSSVTTPSDAMKSLLRRTFEWGT